MTEQFDFDEEIRDMIRSDFETLFQAPEPAPILTVEDLKAAMERLASTPTNPHAHLVHPDALNGRRMAVTLEDIQHPDAMTVRCGACGGALIMAPK